MITLCPKCYFAEAGEKSKFSTKGMSKTQNTLSWGRFKATLEGAQDGKKQKVPHD